MSGHESHAGHAVRPGHATHRHCSSHGGPAAGLAAGLRALEEPAAWTVTANDSTASLQSAGGLGLKFYTGSTMTSLPVTVKVDNFTAVAK